MYEIRLADGSPVYYQGDADYAAHSIECVTTKGDAGYLQFTIPKTNPTWGTLKTRESILEFTQDGYSIGFFEVREITHDMQFSECVYAVGELAWLFDSIQPQAEFHEITPRDFLLQMLRVHNTQCPDHQFTLGIVNVPDSNDSLYRYTNRETTLDDIRDKLVERLGGQIKLRRVNGTRYLDYLTDDTYGSESTQRIYFGENMLDYSDTLTVADICSAVIPLGCRLENDAGDNSTIGNLEKRLTIESVNDGRDWISNSTLVARFGNVRKVQTWDDVTVPANLLQKGRTWLESEQFEAMHLTVKAIDLSMTSQQFGALRCGDFAVVVAEPYGLNKRFPITSRTYHPDAPDQDVIELGTDIAVSFIAKQVRTNKALSMQEEDATYRQTQWLTEAIDNVTAMMVGSRGGYKYTEYDDDGRWLADYILDSDSLETAKIVRKVNLNGTAYSTNGFEGPYETAIMANGIILGKYIQAHSVKAEQISQDYTAMWENADTKTLTTARTEFKAADREIAARVTAVETDAKNVKTDLAAEVKIRADQISQTVKRGQINSAIEQTAETIYIKSNKFGWESTNSKLTTDGTLTARKAVLSDCDVSGTLKLGGANNRNGLAYIYDADNKLKAMLDSNGLRFYHSNSYSTVFKAGSYGRNYYALVTNTSPNSQIAHMHIGGYYGGKLTVGSFERGSEYYSTISTNNSEILGVLWVGDTLKVGANQKNKSNVAGRVYCDSLVVSGTKSRSVNTDNYSDRLLYAYETPSPMFGDIGSGRIGEDGFCFVEIDDVFSETVRTDIDYQVFLQKCGQGDLWVEEKRPTHFVVSGTPGLSFDWELKAHQRGFECERIDPSDLEIGAIEQEEADETT